MYQKILVPLDQSFFSEFALPVALDLARKWSAELHLVTVAVPASPPAFATQGMEMGPEHGGDLPHPEAPFPISEVADEQAEAYLEKTAARLRGIAGSVEGKPLSISHAVEHGDPAEALRSHAAATGVDLVVMTTHARGPITRVWLGSVADELVRHSPTPVLLIRPDKDGEPEFDGQGSFRHILVPLEEWAGSQAVLEDVAFIAGTFESKVTLLHVEALPDGLTSPYIPHVAEERRKWEERERKVEARLEELADGLRAGGLNVESQVIAAREPSDGILDFAEASDIDLIAMTTRGRRGFDRLVRGSVSDEVSRAIDVAVLLRRMEEKARS